MAEELRGKPVVERIKEKLKDSMLTLVRKEVTPKLAIVRIGEKPGDISYQRGAAKTMEKFGVDVENYNLPADIPMSVLLDTIETINFDETTTGCLLLRPFSPNMDDTLIRNSLFVSKDVDGISDLQMAAVYSGLGYATLPCTAEAVIEVLNYYEIPIRGKRVCVVGRSQVIGKPVAMKLLSLDATVTICHSKTENLEEVTRASDIVIAAIGKPQFIGKDHLSPGQVIIDVGINVDSDGNIVGDVNFKEAENIVKAITPVPGGIGSVTTAVLAKHIINAAHLNCI